MNNKKNAQPHNNAELSTTDNAANTNNKKSMTPRQKRVIQALNSTTAWISREAIDRIAGASNGPEVIRQLCIRLGYDAIAMERITVIERDGLATQAGRYQLTAPGRQRLQEQEAMYV